MALAKRALSMGSPFFTQACIRKNIEIIIFLSEATGSRALVFEPVHEISNNVVCATSNASDQPAHTRSLIRAFASRLSIL